MSLSLDNIWTEFDLSYRHGFLPDQWPIKRLSSSYYESWEVLMDRLPSLISDRRVRYVVDDMVVLDTSMLVSEAEWKRAYLVLSFMTHAYIWAGAEPSQVLPPSICCPYLEIAAHFDLPSTATYAALDLWNWAPKLPEVDLTQPENIRILHTFTGTPDEAWFYAISVAIEVEGAKVMPAMFKCFEVIQAENNNEIILQLEQMQGYILRLGEILDRMHERCSPDVFYHQIRPFLAGSKGMTDVGLPNGVFYSTGQGHGSWRQYSGGSNAQSSLVQLLDVMLGVEHYATDHTAMRTATRPRQGYIQEMRAYMPQRHRQFLQYIEERSNIRAYATKDDSHPVVREAYVKALDSLTLLRDKHMGLVARYIIAPSRKPVTAVQHRQDVNIATASSQHSDVKSADQVQLCGTGGTHLMPFLKQTRDETKQAGALQHVGYYSYGATRLAQDAWKLALRMQSSLPVISVAAFLPSVTKTVELEKGRSS